MILAAAIASCFAGLGLRLALGDWAPAVPWMGLAWTLVFARHARLSSFAGAALVLGAIDGVLAGTPWALWPAVYLLAGALAHATRRLFSVESLAGEVVIGAFFAGLAAVAAAPFRPLGLPSAAGALGPLFAGAAATGVAAAVIVWLSGRWVGLRMRLSSVT